MMMSSMMVQEYDTTRMMLETEQNRKQNVHTSHSAISGVEVDGWTGPLPARPRAPRAVRDLRPEVLLDNQSSRPVNHLRRTRVRSPVLVAVLALHVHQRVCRVVLVLLVAYGQWQSGARSRQRDGEACVRVNNGARIIMNDLVHASRAQDSSYSAPDEARRVDRHAAPGDFFVRTLSQHWPSSKVPAAGAKHGPSPSFFGQYTHALHG